MGKRTPHDAVFRDGTARLLHFRGTKSAKEQGRLPFLLVPSMINQWYVLDLRPGSSFVEGMQKAGIDTWCIDWGVPNDEDRYLSWEDVHKRLHRMIRKVKKLTGAPKVALLGYCMGGTLSGISTAMYQDDVAALINLLGPFDFSKAGLLRTMVDPANFDVDSIVNAGNISAQQMQSGFLTMRPTQTMAKWIGFLDRAHDPKAREAFDALEEWASDNIPFPAEAYRTYIRELYQENALMTGQHWVGGLHADTAKITCPVLTIVAERDTICPPPAARGLHDRVSSTDKEIISVPGGHVGAVIGSRAAKSLYPAVAAWLDKRIQWTPAREIAQQSASL